MTDQYFAPMYGGLMLPFTKRQGSTQFRAAGSFYDIHGNSFGNASTVSSPLSSHFADISPHSGMESTPYGYRLPTPVNANQKDSQPDFHFKRSRTSSSASFMDDDASPVSRSAKAVRVSRTKAAYLPTPAEESLAWVNVAKNYELPHRRAYKPSDHEFNDVPMLKFGEEGRARLKSALSDAVRADAEVRNRVEAIGKIRLASMQQLMRMAKVAGLWEYAEALAKEHSMTKQYRKTT